MKKAFLVPQNYQNRRITEMQHSLNFKGLLEEEKVKGNI